MGENRHNSFAISILAVSWVSKDYKWAVKFKPKGFWGEWVYVFNGGARVSSYGEGFYRGL